jgi:hypothetical protein
MIPLSDTFANEVVPVVSLSSSSRHDSCRPTMSSPWKLTELTLVEQLPFTLLVAFGAYLLAKLGYNVFTFHDVPEAHKELMEQIEQARTELRAKGVDVD